MTRQCTVYWNGGCRMVGKGHHHTSLHTPRAVAQAQSLEPFSLSFVLTSFIYMMYICCVLFCLRAKYGAAVKECVKADVADLRGFTSL